MGRCHIHNNDNVDDGDDGDEARIGIRNQGDEAARYVYYIYIYLNYYTVTNDQVLRYARHLDVSNDQHHNLDTPQITSNQRCEWWHPVRNPEIGMYLDVFKCIPSIV